MLKITLLPVGEVAHMDGADILEGYIFNVDIPIANQLVKGGLSTFNFTPPLRRLFKRQHWGVGMLFFVGGERRDEAGEGERERGREQERGMPESFFSLIKVLFYCIPWCSIFLESYGNQETMPVSVLLLFHVSST